jgi:hypothetical protein
MVKIIFGIDVPYKSQTIDWEATERERDETGNFVFGDYVMVPCIRIHKEMSFELCDVCGDQIVGCRAKRKLTTCCPEHNKRKWDTTNGIILERERKLVGERPTWFWQTIRHECFERDDYKCRYCGCDIREHIKRGFKPPEAHHVKPISEGGTNELENLKTACYDCHKKEHSHIENIRRKHVRQHKCLEV